MARRATMLTEVDVRPLLQGLALERRDLEDQLRRLNQREQVIRDRFDVRDTMPVPERPAPRRRIVTAETRKKLSEGMIERWAKRKAVGESGKKTRK